MYIVLTMSVQRTQNFNSIRLTTSNVQADNILLTEASGHLHVNDNPVAISGSFGISDLSSFNFNGNSISNFNASISGDNSTAYTLSDSDSGKLLILNHANEITVTPPTGLSIGFNCSFLQAGQGAIKFAAPEGGTINNRLSHTRTAGQYGMVTFICYESKTFILSGDTTT